MARPEKVAAVDEIKGRITSSSGAVLTEYRGLTVTEIARLRAALRDSGTTYKIYKNTLAIRALETTELGELKELLVGPTAWAFVDGDIVGAAKAIRDFARTNDNLIIKGGLLEGQIISADQVSQIAALPSREELLAKIAGVFKAPMYKTASLLSAIPRNMAYGLKALIDQRIESGETLPVEEAESPAPATDATEAESAAPADEAAKGGTEGEASADTETATDSAPATEAESPAPADEAPEGAKASAVGSDASPEASEASGADKTEGSGPETAGDSEDDSGPEAADGGTSADESAGEVSPEAPEGEASEEASGADTAGASDTTE